MARLCGSSSRPLHPGFHIRFSPRRRYPLLYPRESTATALPWSPPNDAVSQPSGIFLVTLDFLAEMDLPVLSRHVIEFRAPRLSWAWMAVAAAPQREGLALSRLAAVLHADRRGRFAWNRSYLRPDFCPRLYTRLGSRFRPWFNRRCRLRLRRGLDACDRRRLGTGLDLRFRPGFQLGFGFGLRTQFGSGNHELRLRFSTRHRNDLCARNRERLGLRLSNHRFGHRFDLRLDDFRLNDRLFLDTWNRGCCLRDDLHLQYPRRLDRDGAETGYKGDQTRVNHHRHRKRHLKGALAVPVGHWRGKIKASVESGIRHVRRVVQGVEVSKV